MFAILLLIMKKDVLNLNELEIKHEHHAKSIQRATEHFMVENPKFNNSSAAQFQN